jgi:hypothetical protein
MAQHFPPTGHGAPEEAAVTLEAQLSRLRCAFVDPEGLSYSGAHRNTAFAVPYFLSLPSVR